MSIGEILKKVRSERNISIRKLESMSGVAKSTISDIENGGNTSTATLEKLAKTLEIPVEEFFKDNVYSPTEEDEKNDSIKESHEEFIPEQFTIANEARSYVRKHKIFSSEGFNVDKLTDDEVLSFANALLEQMRLVSYKYKK